MELLLVTPVTLVQVVQGQWRAFLRMFAWPLALCLLAQFAGSYMAQHRTWKAMSAATAAPPPVAPTNAVAPSLVVTSTVSVNGSIATATISRAGFHSPGQLAAIGISLAGSVVTVCNLAALVWFGMWMGLTSKSTNMASFKTILFVQVIPWFAISFAAMILTQLVLLPKIISGNTAAASNFMLLFPLITSAVSTVLYLTKDIFFIVWSRRNLYSERGRLAVLPLSHPLSTVPPQLPPAAPPFPPAGVPEQVKTL